MIQASKSKLFSDVPLFTLRKKGNRILYAVADVVDYYIGFQCTQDDIDFKVYFREVNKTYAAYSLKFHNGIKIFMGPSFAVALNSSHEEEATDIKTLYQDKMIRFTCVSTKDKKDYIFIIKNPNHIKDDEESEEDEAT